MGYLGAGFIPLKGGMSDSLDTMHQEQNEHCSRP
jgi:hypothetical protein